MVECFTITWRSSLAKDRIDLCCKVGNRGEKRTTLLDYQSKATAWMESSLTPFLSNFGAPTQMDNSGSQRSSSVGVWFYPVYFCRLQNASRRSLLWLFRHMDTERGCSSATKTDKLNLLIHPTISYLMKYQLGKQSNRNKLVTPKWVDNCFLMKRDWQDRFFITI